jgi:2-polyprenyl-6-methoxyphenol hydroxylase-like FAD-dependent oxidoreductase
LSFSSKREPSRESFSASCCNREPFAYFEDLGLRERILSLGGELPTGISAAVEGKLFSFEFPAADARQAPGIAIVPQRELLELLAAQALAHPEFQIVMGCSARDLIWDNERVAGVRGHTNDGQPIEIRAPITVACDGRFSAIRRAAAIGLRGKPLSFDLLWFSTPIPPGSPNRVYVRISQGELFVSFPSRNNRMQVGWLLKKGAFTKLRSRPLSECVDHIARHVPERLSNLVRTTLTGWKALRYCPL